MLNEQETLLDREGELARIRALVESVARGDGGATLVIEGPPGIGKTRLVGAAAEIAAEHGLQVLGARGAEPERSYAFGVIRQLLEPPLQTGLLTGRAAPALSALGAPTPPAGDAIGVLHGLYWLVAALAERRPLALCVDDAHWADDASLRFLAHLVRRVSSLPALVVLACRQPRRQPLVSELLADPGAETLRPRALGPAAASRLLGERLERSPDPQFTEAALAATGGNPFLLGALVWHLRENGIDPSAAERGRLASLRLSDVARSLAVQLRRAGDRAEALAAALATLDERAGLELAGTLAGLSGGEAADALDALAREGIVADDLPPRFAHPLLRTAVAGLIAPGERSRLHAHAAELLTARRAPPEAVAAQLMAAGPRGDDFAVQQLMAAARQAAGRGSPETAARYLRHALVGATTTSRAAVLHELGRAEAALHDARAADHLQEALRLAHDPEQRARITYELAELRLLDGQWAPAIRLINRALAQLNGSYPELTARLEALRAAMAAYDPAFVDAFDRRRDALHALAANDHVGALAPLLATVAAWRGDRLDQVVPLVESARAGGRSLFEAGAGASPIQAIAALVAVEEIERAARLAQEIVEDASGRGSVIGLVIGWTCRTLVAAHRDLASAADDLRAAFDLATDHQLPFVLPTLLRCGIDPLLERPALGPVADTVETLTLAPPFSTTASGALLLDVRGRLRLMRGEREPALEDLRRCGEINEALGFRNPGCLTGAWRSTAALALREIAPAEAAHLVAEELALARATGLPRAQGVALRASGLVRGGEAGIAQLRESLAILEHSPAALERARTHVELGAALRRENLRTAARESLDAGLELALSCGAERLTARATAELRASGVRVPRRSPERRDALTPSESRIAELAAGGASNPEIAHRLFVSVKTVEGHLSHTYRKLGICSRHELSRALAEPLDSLA